MGVPNRFFGIWNLAYLKARIQDFEGKGAKSRIEIMKGRGTGDFT